jgi:hypothetical protein
MTEYIGRYRAERVVGSGAFATVWLALDETLGAPVAIKVLADNWAHDDEVRARFMEEARILWRADSDHIVRIHNVDELPDGRPYFVMDYADRGTLEERMRRRAEAGERWSVGEAVEIALAVADGLKVAHALGIVHRDLKPANVMFQSVPAHHGEARDEKLILTDFGVAKSLARSRGTTIATGTPHYMAPEQADGRADARSDVYAAAVLLYELLAGRVPYPYESLRQLLAAQHAEEPAPLAEVRPEVPAELAAVVHRGLATDPEARWPTAGAWAEAIAAARGDAPAAAFAADLDVLQTVGPGALAAARAQEAAAATPPAAGAGAVPPGPVGDAPGGAVPPGIGGPPAPPGGAPPPGGGGGRRRPWWKVAVPVLLALAIAGGVVGAIVATGGGEGDAPAVTELLLEPVASVGQDPFTESVVPQPGELDETAIAAGVELPQEILDRLGGSLEDADPAAVAELLEELAAGLNPPLGEETGFDLPELQVPTGSAGRVPTVAGSAPGLYGGTQIINVCDKRALIDFLLANADKARAWAGVHGIDVDEIEGYIRSLTDVVLQVDTRVTNHGFAGGVATAIDSVLQAGTAVLVDHFGVPRVRCYCGNPLLPPRALTTDTPVIKGTAWPGFDIEKTVVISQVDEIPELAIDDVISDDFIFRPPGSDPAEATLTPTVEPIETGPAATEPPPPATTQAPPPATTEAPPATTEAPPPAMTEASPPTVEEEPESPYDGVYEGGFVSGTDVEGWDITTDEATFRVDEGELTGTIRFTGYSAGTDDFLSNICVRYESEIRPGEVGVDLGTGEIGGRISFAASYNEGPCTGGGEGLGEFPLQVSGGISGRELTFVISAEGDSITFVATRQ